MENSDLMMIQSIELAKNTQKESAYNNLPRYRSILNSETETSLPKSGLKGSKITAKETEKANSSTVAAMSPRIYGIDSSGLSK